MKKIKLLSTILLAIFIMGIAFTACEKFDEGESAIQTISNNIIYAKTGEVVRIPSEYSLLSGEFDASIGVESIAVRVLNDNVYLLVPDMESGEYELSININDESFAATINITRSEVVEQPVEYLASLNVELTDYILSNIENIESLLEAGLIEEDIAQEYIANWEAQEGKFAAEIAKLSNDEKQTFANFMETNKAWIDVLRNYMVAETSNNKGKLSCLDLKEKARLAKIDGRDYAYIWFGLRYKHCIADNAQNPPNELGQVEFTFSWSPSWMETVWDSWVEPIFDNVESQLNALSSDIVAEKIEEDKNKSLTTFVNNTPQELSYNIKFRSVNESDANGPFSHVVGVINGFIGFFDSLAEDVSHFIGIDISFTNTSSISRFNRFMTIKNISNSNVTLLSSEIIDDKWEVAFKSSGGEQEFTFDVFYDDGKVQISKSYNAILTVYEPYSIEILSGNNQSGEAGEILDEPIEVLVKDEDGNPFEGALVTFDVSEGSVTFEENTTNADGIAFTHWELGGNNDEQQLIARVFKSDGLTPVLGSPLVFNAEELAFVYEGVWLRRWINADGTIYQDDRITFDVNGESTLYEYNIYQNNVGWQVNEDTQTLRYSGGRLRTYSHYWGLSLYFIVNSVDDNVFYGEPGQTAWDIELHRQ